MGEGKAVDAMQPLAIAVLAGLTPPTVELAFFDDRIETIPYDIATDAVALSVETYAARRSYQIAAEFRRRGVHVIMGGYHPSLAQEEALQHADTVVVGDAEGVWPQVVADGLKGSWQRVYRSDHSRMLQGICYDRSLFQAKKYAPIYPVQFGRGCRYSCEFCSVNAFYHNRLRQRPVAEVIAEMEASGQRYFLLVDDNLWVDRVQTRKLLLALKPLQIRWVAQVSLDITQDPELLWLMAQSGCIAVQTGFESLDSRNLTQMGKQANLATRDYPLAVRKLRDQGMMVYGSFVFGYDGDNRDTFDRALDFALDNKLMLANFNPLTPMPGTPLYQRLAAEGRLLHPAWWNDPGFKYGAVAFQPRGMAAEELAEGCRRIRFEFNQYASVARRAVDFKANSGSFEKFALYLIANLVSRSEIHRKQGAGLGGIG